MKLAEIERDLSSSDPKVRHWILRMMEMQIEIQRQLNQCADVLVETVNALDQLKVVNLTLNERWQRQLRGLPPEGDIVESVINEPEN